MSLTNRKADPDRGKSVLQWAKWRAGAAWFFLAFAVMMIPGLVSLWLVAGYLGSDPFAYAPQWSDEIFHWHQVATFRLAGFQGGYYTVNEQPAPFAMSHFYTHGPVYPMLFGTLGRLAGWGLTSAPIMGALLTSLALGIFVFLTRPDWKQLLLLGLVMLTFWPTHLYMATDMRLIFFVAIAIVLAGCFYRTITDPRGASPLFLTAFGLLLVAATVSKLTWSFLFFPYLLHIRQRLRLTVVQSCVVSGVLILLGFGAHSQLAAPYPNFASELLQAFRLSFVGGGVLLLEHAGTGFGDFFDRLQSPLWLMLRVQMLVTIVCAGFLIRGKADGQEDFREGLVLMANSGLIIVLAILLYDIFGWRDFRLFAPPLLLASLIFVARRRFVMVALLLAGNLLVGPAFFEAYGERFSHRRYSGGQAKVEAFANEISSVVQYDPAGEGWENTILLPKNSLFNPILAGIPPGIGISWFEASARLGRVKSRYLLLDSEGRLQLGRQPGLKYIKETALGGLYVNRDTGPGSE